MHNIWAKLWSIFQRWFHWGVCFHWFCLLIIKKHISKFYYFTWQWVHWKNRMVTSISDSPGAILSLVLVETDRFSLSSGNAEIASDWLSRTFSLSPDTPWWSISDLKMKPFSLMEGVLWTFPVLTWPHQLWL